jgi:cobalt-zinc-cadmium efflux system outer membrane protein
MAGTVMQARLRLNPTLDFEVQDTRRASRETTIQLSQAIELGSKRAYRVAAAEKAHDGAAIAVQAKWNEIRAEVTKAFYDLLVAQERLTLANGSLTNAQRATFTAANRVNAGKISPVDETKARIAEAVVRLELLQAKSELATASRRLASLCGSKAAQFAHVSGALEEIPRFHDLPTLMQRLASSPTLLAAQIEVEQRQAIANLERSKRIPDVSISLGIKRAEELGRNQAIIGLSVPLPLFDRNQGNVLESLRRTDKARDELNAASVSLHAELGLAYAKFDVAQHQAATIRAEILPGAKKAFDAAATGFEFGKFALLDVLDAQRTLLQTQAHYLQALSDLHRAAADIERLVDPVASPNKL